MSMHPREWRALHEIDDRLSAEDPPMAQWLAGLTRWRHPKWVVGAAYLVAPVLLTVGIVLPFIPLLLGGIVLAVATPVVARFLLRPPANPGVVEDLLDDL